MFQIDRASKNVLSKFGKGMHGYAKGKLVWALAMIVFYLFMGFSSIIITPQVGSDLLDLDFEQPELTQSLLIFFLFIGIVGIIMGGGLFFFIIRTIIYLRRLLAASKTPSGSFLKKIFILECGGIIVIIITGFFDSYVVISLLIGIVILSFVTLNYLKKWTEHILKHEIEDGTENKIFTFLNIMKIGLFIKLLEFLRIFESIAFIGVILSFIGGFFYIFGMWKTANEIIHFFEVEKWPEKLEEEESLLLLLILPEGEPLLIHSFSPKWSPDKELFSGFLSGIHSWGSEVFSQSADIMTFGENKVIMRMIEPFMVVYVIKGQPKIAQQKVEKFIDILKSTPTMWDILIQTIETQKTIDSQQIPALKKIIIQTFSKSPEKSINT